MGERDFDTNQLAQQILQSPETSVTEPRLSAETTPINDTELDEPLLRYAENGAIKESLQNKIACRLWRLPLTSSTAFETGLVAYFAHFQREINLWSAPKQNVAIDTYRDFLDLIQHLTSCKDQRRDSPEVLRFFPAIKGAVSMSGKVGLGDTKTPLPMRYQFTTQEEVDNAIELTVGLWLMIYMGPSNSDIFLGVGRWHIDWPNHMSLIQVLDTNFETSPLPPVVRGEQFPKDLCVYNLERIGGFQIMWTSSLKNHLAFDEETMTIVLYHFATVLDLHEKNDEQRSILPDGLAEETSRTLALLLPPFDVKSKRWYQQARKRANGVLDGTATTRSLGPRGREIDSFRFWQQRLVAIAEAFDNAEPRGFKAWWFDRRNGVQWTNFWLAMTVLMVTAVFGMISAITGIIQVYYAARA